MSTVYDRFESILGKKENLKVGGEVVQNAVKKYRDEERKKAEAAAEELVVKAVKTFEEIEKKKREFNQIISGAEKELGKILSKIESLSSGNDATTEESKDDKDV